MKSSPVKLVLALALAVSMAYHGLADFAYSFTADIRYNGSETLTDFPVLVRLPGVVTSRMRSDGLDVRFYLQDGVTELAHECEDFVHRSVSLFWVKIPALASGTKIVVKFGDPSFDTAPAGAPVWSSYSAVWHLDNVTGTSGYVVDSTGGCANGDRNSTCNVTDGKLASAVRINVNTDWTIASNHRITVNNKGALATDGKMTVSWWMKSNATGGMPRNTEASSYLFQVKDKSAHVLWGVGYHFADDSAPTFNLETREENNGNWSALSVENADEKLDLPGWHFAACTLENAQDGLSAAGTIFADKVQLAQGDGLNPLLSLGNGGTIRIGCSQDASDNYKGSMDEVRIRAAVSSVDWLEAEYDSVNDPEFVKLPNDLPGIFNLVTRRVVATAGEKAGDWADAAVAGDNAAAVIQGVIDESDYGDVILFKAGNYELTSELSFPTLEYSGLVLRSDDGNGNLARETTRFIATAQNRLINCDAEGVQIEGITFTNGYVDAAAGGAIRFSCADSKTLVRNCDFLGNTAWWAAKESQTSALPTGTTEASGGAIYIKGAGVISNCLFRGNRAFSGGAMQTASGVKALSSRGIVPYITDCTFVGNSNHGPGNNTYDYGSGAAFCSYGAAIVENSSFVSNNLVSTRGMAQVVNGLEGLRVSRCYFERNRRDRTGNYGCNVVVGATKTEHCVFKGETQTALIVYGDTLDGHAFIDCGGHIALSQGAVRNCLFVGTKGIDNNMAMFPNNYAGQVDNCTFIGNSLVFRMNEIGARTNVLNNCVFLGNTQFVGQNNPQSIQEKYFQLNNCVFAGKYNNSSAPAPIYVNSRTDLTLETARFVDAANGDYHLDRRSPLRNAGIVLDWMTAGTEDLDGNPRVLNAGGRPGVGALPDIGCYECALPSPGFVVIFR